MIVLSSLTGNIAAGLWLLLIGVVGRRQCRSWLSPSSVLALFWSCAIVIPSVVAPDSVPGLMGVGFIVSWITLFHLGTMLAWSRQAEPISDRPRARVYTLPFASLPVWIAVISGLAALFYLAVVYYRATGTVPIRDFAAVGRLYARYRYAEGVGLPVVVRALNVVLNAGVIYSGVWTALSREPRRWLGPLLLFGTGVLQAFTVSSRMGVIWMGLFGLSAYAAAALLVPGRARRLAAGLLRVVAFGCVGLIVLFVGVQILREGQGSQGLEVSLVKARSAMLSAPHAFATWLATAGRTVTPRWGASSLAGFIPSAPGGLEWEKTPFRVGDIVTNPNVYTGFRQLVEDLTVRGALAISPLLGFVAGVVFRYVRRGQVSFVPLLGLLYSLILGGYISNWLCYSTLALAWTVASLGLAAGGLRVRGTARSKLPIPASAPELPASGTRRISPS